MDPVGEPFRIVKISIFINRVLVASLKQELIKHDSDTPNVAIQTMWGFLEDLWGSIRVGF